MDPALASAMRAALVTTSTWRAATRPRTSSLFSNSFAMLGSLSSTSSSNKMVNHSWAVPIPSKWVCKSDI